MKSDRNPPKDKKQARAESLYLEAFAHLQVGKARRAERAARRALKIQEDHPQGQALLALALRAGGLFGEAEKHARRALELAPGQPDLLFILGLCLWSAGAPEEARTLFEEAVQKAPERSDLVMDYAGFLIYQRQFQDALALAEKARALAPNHPKPIVLETCAREESWNSAVDALAFRAPLPLPEGEAETFVRVGKTLISFGYYDLALGEFSRALDIDAGCQDAQTLYATAFRMRKNANYSWFRHWRNRLANPWTLLLTFLPLLGLGGGAWFLYCQKEPLLAIICVGLGLVYLLGVACALGFYARRLTTRDFQTLVQSRNLTPQGRQKRTSKSAVTVSSERDRGFTDMQTVAPSIEAIPQEIGGGEDSARLRRHLEGQGALLRNYSNSLFTLAILALTCLAWIVLRKNTPGVLLTPTLLLAEKASAAFTVVLVSGALWFRAKARSLVEPR
ncbi:MAG: tetratricopeptide repeat protein [Candidatus Xenobium sp.]|nr:tetratricopeptide repeat protein [Burkholderiales bacterium]